MAKKEKLSLGELLEQAIVKDENIPYELPSNWVWTKVGYVSEFERGITFPSSAKNHGEGENLIPCIRTANIQEQLEIDDLLYIDRSYMKKNTKKLLSENDILMSSANSRELVGKVSYVENLSQEMTFGGFVLNIRAQKILSKILFYYLRLEFLSGKFMGESTQTTNIANINSTILSEYLFPLSPLSEQQRIVNLIESIFEKLDRAKELAQNALNSFDNRKSAILHKAFTGELTAKWREENGVDLEKDWEEKKCKDIPYLTKGADENVISYKLPNRWKWMNIGDLFNVFSGKGFKEKEYAEDGIKLLRITNVSYNGLVWDDCKFLPIEYTQKEKDLIVKKDDIVLALNRPITNNKLKISKINLDGECILYQRVGCLRIVNEE